MLTSGFHFGSEFPKINSRLGFTQVFTFYDHYLNPAIKPYSIYNFRDNRLLNSGLDFQTKIRNIHLFGEVSTANFHSNACVLGVLLSPDEKVDLVFHYRNFAKDFLTTFNNPVSEFSDGRNEEGMYSGAVIKLNRIFTTKIYLDIFSAPWLRYLVNVPEQGSDLLFELDAIPDKNTNMYFRYRKEMKGHNVSEVGAKQPVVNNVSREMYRLHFQFTLSPLVESKSRIEVSSYSDQYSPVSKGSAIFQEFTFTVPAIRMRINSRVTLFNVESYNARIYTMESDVPFQYAVPFYSNKGIAFHLMLNFKFSRQLDFWIKYADINYSNLNEISSGLQQINGNELSSMTLELKWTLWKGDADL